MTTYPLSNPKAICDEAVEAGVRCLRAGRFTMGPEVEAFEDEVAAYLGVGHAVMVNSGSSANLLAVESMLRASSGTLRWPPEGRIAVPALCWPTSVWPLVQLGLEPVFVDIDPVTLALDWRKMTAPVWGAMLIHVLGAPATRHPLPDFPVIEDACESFGAPGVGRSGLTTWSHFFSHQLPTMEGGLVTTDDPDVADDLRSMRSHGWTRGRRDRARWEASVPAIDPRFCFVTTGYNVRPLEVEAAMGRVQLRYLPEQWIVHQQTGEILRNALPAWLQPPTTEAHGWMNLPLIVREDAPLVPAQVKAAFEEAGIETRPIISGNLLRHPVLQARKSKYSTKPTIKHVVDPAGYPVADRVMDRGFMIGCWDATRGLECLDRALSLMAVLV